MNFDVKVISGNEGADISVKQRGAIDADFAAVLVPVSGMIFVEK